MCFDEVFGDEPGFCDFLPGGDVFAEGWVLVHLVED